MRTFTAVVAMAASLCATAPGGVDTQNPNANKPWLFVDERGCVGATEMNKVPVHGHQHCTDACMRFHERWAIYDERDPNDNKCHCALEGACSTTTAPTSGVFRFNNLNDLDKSTIDYQFKGQLKCKATLEGPSAIAWDAVGPIEACLRHCKTHSAYFVQFDGRDEDNYVCICWPQNACPDFENAVGIHLYEPATATR